MKVLKYTRNGIYMTKFRTQKYKKETSHKLYKVAQDDLYAAEILFTAPKYRPETVLYHVQQAIEKSAKSVLIFREIAVPLSHDIDLLLSELPNNLTTTLPPSLGELTQYATIRRYLDGEELIEPKDIQAAIAAAKIVLAWAADLILVTT